MKPIVKTDHNGCWGCKACEIACLQEHELPKGIKLLKIMEEKPALTNDKLNFTFKSKRCLHCEKPHCQAACPKQAIIKEADTGIVLIEHDKCNGCNKTEPPCKTACPFDAITFDKNAGKAYKCDLCHFRVTQGLIPACADNVCLAHCIYFGDRSDINTRVKEKEWLKYRKEGKLREMVIRLED